MGNASKYSKRNREAKATPFTIKFDEDDGRETIVIPKPGARELMNAEESGTTRGFLWHMCGEQYDAVMEFCDEDLDPEGLKALVEDMTEHFGVSASQAPEGKRRR